MEDYTATYSPEDNKLRLYTVYRLDKEEYQRVRAEGFRWAPKQELFVAPMWTPKREDLLLEMCGEIGDEDTDLVTRAEMRAERFGGYSDNRRADAENAKYYVDSIADGIPMGQPILVGHHSEKRARRDAQRIENGMRHAVKMWETSKYWKMRAAGAIRHAKYKERPDVRARRIKKIEAERRKCEKNIKEARQWLNVWLRPIILTRERALFVANYSYTSGLWSALNRGEITARAARNKHVPQLESTITHNERWITHCNNRLVYEKAMLESQGASDLLKKKKRPKLPPILNYKAPAGITTTNPPYYAEKTSHLVQVEMTRAEYKGVPKDYKGCQKVGTSHRVRICMGAFAPKVVGGSTGTERLNKRHSYYAVFLTDSKVHKKTETEDAKEQAPPAQTLGSAIIPVYTKPERTEFDDMKDTLREGVKIVSAPQLFPTPQELAEKVFYAAEIEAGMQVLEPSAGTGNLIKPIIEKVDTEILAYEINGELCKVVASSFPPHRVQVRRKDFLEVDEFMGQYDRIVMNPPFKNGEDIKHIKHAAKFLRPGGRLVALCANGPRQQKQLKPLAEDSGGYWEDLPQGSFKNQGTNVNTAMLVIEG